MSHLDSTIETPHAIAPWLRPPVVVPSIRFTALPAAYRQARVTPWSRTNFAGQALPCFLEGPVFNAAGELLVTDIPNGRIFCIDAAGAWRLLAEYDGWPNGLKINADGVIHIADNKRGIMTLDAQRGTVLPLIEGYRGERFKGVNDLHFAHNGDLYFTDQGQTGWHDPSGSVFRYQTSGDLSCLCDRLPSPNGLTLNAAQTQLFVAVTRANAVWRLPLMADGGVSKVGTFIQMSGGAAGPDGITLDSQGGLVVAHPGTTVWRFDRNGLATHVVAVAHDAFFTNLTWGCGNSAGNSAAYSASDGATDIFITDSLRGEIWRASLPLASDDAA